MLSKLSNLNSNLTLTLGYLNPALNNSAQVCKIAGQINDIQTFSRIQGSVRTLWTTPASVQGGK